MSSSRDGAPREPARRLAALTPPNSSAPNQATSSSTSPESTDAEVSGGAWVTTGTKAWRWQGQKQGVDIQALCPHALIGVPGDKLVACTWCTETTPGECLGFTQSKPCHPDQAREPVSEEKMTAPAGTGQVSPWIQHLLFMFQNKLHYFCSRLIVTPARRLSSCLGMRKASCLKWDLHSQPFQIPWLFKAEPTSKPSFPSQTQRSSTTRVLAPRSCLRQAW